MTSILFENYLGLLNIRLFLYCVVLFFIIGVVWKLLFNSMLCYK